MKVVITGSHFSPAYAVIRKSTWDVAYIGRKYAFDDKKKESLEYTLCRKEKIPFREIDVPRFSRVKSFASFPLIRFLRSVRTGQKILQEINPDVVVSFGGYVSLPVVFAAKIKGKPIIIHEQTLDAGLSNKIAAKFASKIFISFPTSRKYFPKNKTILTGNPVRAEILEEQDRKPVVGTERRIIYITGGSTGSAAINSLVDPILPILTKNYFVIHQKGLSLQKSESLGIDKKNYLERDFFSPGEVAWIFKNASLVVSRSGINTVTEILTLGTPAIFIPLPYGQKNEQLKNAKYALKNGRTRFFIQEELTSSILLDGIRDMMKKRVSKKYDNAPDFLIHKKATDKIIHETEKVYEKKQV